MLCAFLTGGMEGVTIAYNTYSRIEKCLLYIFSILGHSRKNKQRGAEKIYTFLDKNPGNFSFLTLSLEISHKTKLQVCWELHKIMLRPKTNNLGNSTQFALGHP